MFRSFKNGCSFFSLPTYMLLALGLCRFHKEGTQQRPANSEPQPERPGESFSLEGSCFFPDASRVSLQAGERLPRAGSTHHIDHRWANELSQKQLSPNWKKIQLSQA